jgi:hypothetical protein
MDPGFRRDDIGVVLDQSKDRQVYPSYPRVTVVGYGSGIVAKLG